MYPTMMPPLAALETTAPLDVRVLAHIVDNTHDHELFAPALDGESAEERAAREAAAADIIDDLVDEARGCSA
ncbi:hypothetical protein [Nocardiopsis sp. MG754419]|uniref:hypothetical protein n=1 Tax=Nocardiopsis sp. MG754419 TaxID=2259865 RepID=UPI001BAB46DB|nr:hypothetical protein [Nocardiopsis sp. MG754419]MBR8745326.1 hypothetical protein [Nocardiopsis sp. MG754419]